MRPFQYINISFIIAVFSIVLLHIAIGVSLWWIVAILVIHLAIITYGVVNIRANFFIRSKNRLTDNKYVVLTFDDGPVANTSAILDVLKEQGVKATFFCIGNNIAEHSDVLKRIDNEGHIVGNHSFYHASGFDWQSSLKMHEEIDQTNNTIKSVIGKTPTMFRPPYGITNPNLSRAVKRSGMSSIGWSVRSFDTVIKDENKLTERIVDHMSGGDIILLHDTMSITHKILTNLIVKAREKGFIFVALDEALGLNAYEETH